jgi:hypothetical protein
MSTWISTNRGAGSHPCGASSYLTLSSFFLDRMTNLFFSIYLFWKFSMGCAVRPGGLELGYARTHLRKV